MRTIVRGLATVLVLAILSGVISKIAPIPLWQGLLMCAGWALVYFGDELAPILGLESTPATAQYIDPIVRGIGWLFLLVAFGLYCARALHIW